jgi:ABC-2 type transport system permease protein
MVSLVNFVSKTGIILEFEVRKIIHDPFELFVRMIQPILWLVVFGTMFNRIGTLDTGGVSYISFIAPGIIAQSILFTSIFYGIAITWDKDSGILAKLMVTPTSRGSIILGKGLSSGVRGIVQSIVIIILAIPLGVAFIFSPFNILCVVAIIVLAATCFACLSIVFASFLRRRERFMGVIQLITMPFFFASNALYPVNAMPPLLQDVTRINPLFYVVDGLRSLLITGDLSALPLDFGALLLITFIFVLAGIWGLKRLME